MSKTMRLNDLAAARATAREALEAEQQKAFEAAKLLTAEDFRALDKSVVNSEEIARPSLTFWQDVWRRLRQNKAAMFALCLLITLILFSIFGPIFSSWSPTKIDGRIKDITPNATHWFGTDLAGRDIFARVWTAGRASLKIGLLGALISTTVGVIYGAISGFVGGKLDILMMRIVEILASLPYLLIIILLQLYINSRSLGTMLLALTLTAWTGTARMVRGQILHLKGLEYVQASRVLGVSPWKIIRRHLIPNAMPIVIVGITFDVPGYIFAESFLSYLGIGLVPPDTSWGIMCSEATGNLLFEPYQMFFPSLMIALTMLSFTLLGDGLRDALDPRLRK